jgi:hypothetical protein
MRSTATALPGTRLRLRQPALSRLGPWHFAVPVAVLLLHALLLGIILWVPVLTGHLARLEVQRHEAAFGFRLEMVHEHVWPEWRIADVVPGGRLSAAGFRPGDLPIDHHGGGLQRLEWPLRESAAGRRACVMVRNDHLEPVRREVCLAGPSVP